MKNQVKTLVPIRDESYSRYHPAYSVYTESLAVQINGCRRSSSSLPTQGWLTQFGRRPLQRTKQVSLWLTESTSGPFFALTIRNPSPIISKLMTICQPSSPSAAIGSASTDIKKVTISFSIAAIGAAKSMPIIPPN